MLEQKYNIVHVIEGRGDDRAICNGETYIPRVTRREAGELVKLCPSCLEESRSRTESD